MAFFSQVSLLLALLSVTHSHGAECDDNAAWCANVEDEATSNQVQLGVEPDEMNFMQLARKVQPGLKRAETGNGLGVTLKLDLSATLSSGNPCAPEVLEKTDEDHDACVKAALKDSADAQAVGGISNCADLAKAEWCTAHVEEHSSFFGNACPVSCHWDKCEDHHAQFKQECGGKDGCSQAPHENCHWAVGDGWCSAESKAGAGPDGMPAKLDHKTAHWIHWICRKSCCEAGGIVPGPQGEAGDTHHTCGKVCKKEEAKPADTSKAQSSKAAEEPNASEEAK